MKHLSTLLAPGLLLAVALPAHAQDLRVGPGGYPTLAAAVAAAHAGDVLHVAAGTYREHVVLDKAIALVGEGRPTLDGLGSGDTLEVRAPGCRISGLHITHSGKQVLGENAAIKLAAGHTVVEDNVLDDSYFGIYMDTADSNQIRRNVIHGMTELSVNDRGDAIRLYNSRFNVVEGNTIESGRDGIFFDGASQNTMSRNVISKVRYGLHYMSSDDNVFNENRFTETEAGSALMFSHRITLRGNYFVGNRGFRAYGLLLKECEDSVVEGNVMAGNRVGLFIDGGLNDRIARNQIVGNDVGIDLRANSEGNTFEGNSVAGNTDAVSLPTGVSENRWDGNYWSDYRGYDLDGDGRGDVPHHAGSVFTQLTENFPPARLFLLSPAIQALEFAEHTFPVIDTPTITDERPAIHPVVSEAHPLPGGLSLPLLLLSGVALVAGLVPLLFAGKAFRS